MCRHCEDAPCVVVCPSKALEKSGSEQPVMVSADRCIGCKLCMLVCPFGVILFNQDKKAAFKCDICLQRQAAGKPPACVAACKSGSLQLVSLEEFTRKKRQQAATTLKKAEDAGRLVLQPD
jgi:Fe-S-cluster-containing dehydrogenase component